MATKVRPHLIDDLDGSPAAETVHFSIDKKHYVIDLSAKNAEHIRRAFAAWAVFAARQRNTGPSQSAKIVREWAAANGHDISPTGPIPKRIKDAYAKHMGF